MSRSLRLVSWQPIDAICVGIDPGRYNGAAIVRGDELLAIQSTANTRRGRDRFLELAQDYGDDLGLPVVVAVETWTSHGKWGFKQAMGLGEQAGRWLADVEELSPDLVVRVEPGEWRRALFGGGPNRKTEEWKRLARAHVRAAFDRDAEEDESEAACIAHWATRASRIAERLGRRRSA